MAMEVKEVSPQDLFKALQRGTEDAEEYGRGMIIDIEGNPLEGVLATLARVQFIEMALQLGAATMLGCRVAEIDDLTKGLKLTILLDRVMNGGMLVEDALVLSGGYGEAQIRMAAAGPGALTDPESAVEAIADLKKMAT